jgi:integrase
VQANPTSGLSVPSINRRRTRFATVEQIEALLSCLDRPKDRALWATALYAGLRRGELQALHREDVDLARGVIRVERGWDQCEGEVPPKSKQGRRRVPIPALRDRLLDYRLRGTDGRRRREREGAVHVHGTRQHKDHARPVRPPVARAEDEAAGLLDAFLARQAGGTESDAVFSEKAIGPTSSKVS